MCSASVGGGGAREAAQRGEAALQDSFIYKIHGREAVARLEVLQEDTAATSDGGYGNGAGGGGNLLGERYSRHAQ